MRLLLKENQFLNFQYYLLEKTKFILESEQDNDYYYLTAPEYEELLKLSGYHGKGVTKIKKFEGKPLYIKGNVDLSSTPTDSLGNVAVINGNLDIRFTKISDLGNTKVTGSVWDWSTPLENIRKRKEKRRKLEEMNELRVQGDWDVENLENMDELGRKANALFNYLRENSIIDTISEKEEKEIKEIKNQIQNLENEEFNDEIENQIEDLQNKLYEILDDKTDVYGLYPHKYRYFDLTIFSPIEAPNDSYTVGTESEMDDSLESSVNDMISEVGLGGFTNEFLNNYIDTQELKDFFEDFYYNDIVENPEAYFSDEDFELTPEQEKRIEDIETEIENYQSEQENLDSEDENYQELYDDFQSLIDELTDEKESIIPDTDTPTEDMIDDKLRDMLDDVVYNPLFYINEFGLNLQNFINESDLVDAIVRDEGYGQLNNYDGSYDTQSFDGETFYIMRIE